MLMQGKVSRIHPPFRQVRVLGSRLLPWPTPPSGQIKKSKIIMLEGQQESPPRLLPPDYALFSLQRPPPPNIVSPEFHSAWGHQDVRILWGCSFSLSSSALLVTKYLDVGKSLYLSWSGLIFLHEQEMIGSDQSSNPFQCYRHQRV